MFIGDYLGRRTLYSPDALAIVDAGKPETFRLTYEQMNNRANRLANWLQDEVGVRKDERVAILAKDGIEHLDTFFACGKLGAIHTTFNWRLHWRELQDLLVKTAPKVLIFSEDFEDIVSEIQKHNNSLKHFLHIEGEGLEGSLLFDAVLQEGSDKPVRCDKVIEEDIAALIFTGGTTGTPKGAQISHRMIAWNTLNTIIHDLHHGDTFLNVFPMFHTGGLFVYTLPNIIMGGTTILIREFDPNQVLNLIEKESVSVFAGVPTMYQLLSQAEAWDEADLSSLRFCTSGGAPLPVSLVEKYVNEKNIAFKQGFGMTEYGPGLFALAPEDAISKAGSIGRPNFFIEATIMDEERNFLGPDHVGELVLRGPSRATGYYKNHVASNEVLDKQGYFHTGDLAKYDEDGYFYIVDRKKDMYISGGENVFPVEVENVLYENSAIQMCAVVGVADEKWGEIGVACIVLKPEQILGEAEISDFLSERLAKFKLPRRFIFMAELPISAAGKILKQELKDKISKQEI